jgi:hypothetical protein
METAALRSTGDTSPGFMFRTCSANTVGNRAPGRQPRCLRARRAGVGESGGDLSELTAAPDLPEGLLGAAAPASIWSARCRAPERGGGELVFGIGILRLTVAR